MSNSTTNRREMLSLLGASGVGVVFASGLAGCTHRGTGPDASEGFDKRAESTPSAPPGAARAATNKDFFFVQMSDTHWGYKGPANPEADVTLKKTVQLINSSTHQPDFIVFTGDLTHTTDDPAVRRQRLSEFKAIVSELKVKNLKFIPGEHDASLDSAQAYREFFGEPHWTWDYEGVHFVALDNVSDIDGGLGEAQLAWLEADLAKVPPEVPVVVFAHRPLFDMQPQWEWWTRDGAKAISILERRRNVTVFYGHIHQEHHHMTGEIAHHSARSLIFQLPQAGTVPKRAPLPWNPANPDKGIGFRQVIVDNGKAPASMNLTDFTSAGARLPRWHVTPPGVPAGPPPAAMGPTAGTKKG